MNPTEVDPITIEMIVTKTIEKCNDLQPQRMEFSKKLIIGASIYFALFGIASYVIWILTGDWPREIAVFFIGPVVALISYMVKSGYENKAKIESYKSQKEV